MLDKYIDRIAGMKEFDNRNIDRWFITLDECTLNALEVLSREPVPEVPYDSLDKPIVMGSGNAYRTGVLLFEDVVSFTATESTYKQKLDSLEGFVKSGVVISASGSKNAGGISEELQKRGIKNRVLITCSRNSEAEPYFDKDSVFVFPKNPEPYTYNTSTYMGMLLSKYKSSPEEILNHLNTTIEPILKDNEDNLRNATGFYLFVPNEAENIGKMFQVKFEELFARSFGAHIFTPEFADKHATDIVKHPGELKIAFGCHGPKRSREDIYLPLLDDDNPRDYPSLMAVGYYTVGKIQKSPDRVNWFKNNIIDWITERGKNPLVL